jgi:urease accessory protein
MLDHIGAHGARAQGGREIESNLRFEYGGGRTFLQHQRVPYPFHITRPHALDAKRPDLATLILQSVSGGLYDGDELTLNIVAGEGALAQVTSQAATVVHGAVEDGTVVCTRIQAAQAAFLSVSHDPYVLFPDATLSVRTDVTLGSRATIIVAEGFAAHDPKGTMRPFGRLSVRCRIVDEAGKLAVDEAGTIDGAVFFGSGSPLGQYRAMGTVMVLGEAGARLGRCVDLGRQLDCLGVLGGATILPNETGLCVRLLAGGGGQLAKGLDVIVAAAFEASFDHPPPGQRR